MMRLCLDKVSQFETVKDTVNKRSSANLVKLAIYLRKLSKVSPNMGK